MRGTAAKQAGEGSYEYDAEGNLVPLPDEPEEARFYRESEVLYKEGMSVNHPDDVAAQYAEEEPPPPEIEEGEEQEAYDQRKEQARSEWEQRNEQKRQEFVDRLEQEKQEREQRAEERKSVMKDKTEANDSNDPSYGVDEQDTTEENEPQTSRTVTRRRTR